MSERQRSWTTFGKLLINFFLWFLLFLLRFLPIFFHSAFLSFSPFSSSLVVFSSSHRWVMLEPLLFVKIERKKNHTHTHINCEFIQIRNRAELKTFIFSAQFSCGSNSIVILLKIIEFPSTQILLRVSFMFKRGKLAWKRHKKNGNYQYDGR